MRPATYTWSAADAVAICQSQTGASGATLVINGTWLDLPATMNGVNRVVQPAIQRTVTIASTANVSGVLFTVVGKDVRQSSITETITGPNNTTVISTNQYSLISSITASGAFTASAVTVGIGSVGSTNWYKCSNFADLANITVGVTVSGAISATVQNTLDDVETNASPVTFPHPTISATASNIVSNYAYPPRNVRITNSGSTNSGAMVFTIIQSGG